MSLYLLVLLILMVLLVALYIIQCISVIILIQNFEYEIPWKDFKNVNNIVFNNFEEENFARNLFYAKLESIKLNNEKQLAELNPFVNSEEQYFCQQTWNTKHLIPLENLEDNFNWLPLFPNPAYSQGNVKTCYSFASVQVLEALSYQKTLEAGMGLHIKFSKQEIVDCGYGCGANGTNKGHMMNAFLYMWLNGLYKEEQYEYRHNEDYSGDISMEYLKRGTKVPKQKIYGYGALPPKATDNEIKTALKRFGPLAVGIFSEWPEFKAYNGTQIITRENAPIGPADHAVVLVGWGKDSVLKKEYWIIRNSYGSNWGKNGYAYIEMGWNVLGINDHVTYISSISSDGHFDEFKDELMDVDVEEFNYSKIHKMFELIVKQISLQMSKLSTLEQNMAL